VAYRLSRNTHRTRSAPAAARVSVALAALVGTVGLAAAGCGRSSLDDDIDTFPVGEIDASPGDTSTSDVRVIDSSPADVSRSDVTQVMCNANHSNCTTGCCDSSGVCQPAFVDTTCGPFGGRCVDCTTEGAGLSCAFNGNGYACEAPPPPACDSSNCSGGCCDSNGVCMGGFIDTGCGQGGASCIDCTAIGSTCDTNTTPRVCASQQTVCPAPYGACPSGLQTTPSALHQGACSVNDLQQAAEACSAGAHTKSCDSFFTFEAQQSMACGKCLTPFDFDFTELKGLLACVAPFVDSTCNHGTACVADCANATCAQCPEQVTQLQCEAQEVTSGGSCAPFVQDIEECVGLALAINAQFCNPGQTTTSFGTWLANVGTQFCGN
jgi:hypothetical protein